MMSEAPRNGKQAQDSNCSNAHRADSSQSTHRSVEIRPTQSPESTPINNSPFSQQYRFIVSEENRPYAQAAYHLLPAPVPHAVQVSGNTWPHPFPQSSQDQHHYPSPVHLQVPIQTTHHEPGPRGWYAFRSPYDSVPFAVLGNDDSQSTSPLQATGSSLDTVQVPEDINGIDRMNGISGWDRLRAAQARHKATQQQRQASMPSNTTSTETVPSSAPHSNEGDTPSRSGGSRQPGGPAPHARGGFMNPGYQPTRRPRSSPVSTQGTAAERGDRSDDSREETPPPPYSR